MSNSANTVYVCAGKDCRKHKKTCRWLAESLPPGHTLEEVRCQKICSPSVIGLRHKDDLVWLKKMKSRKDVIAIVSALENNRLGSRLKGKVVKKRTNRLRE